MRSRRSGALTVRMLAATTATDQTSICHALLILEALPQEGISARATPSLWLVQRRRRQKPRTNFRESFKIPPNKPSLKPKTPPRNPPEVTEACGMEVSTGTGIRTPVPWLRRRNESSAVLCFVVLWFLLVFFERSFGGLGSKGHFLVTKCQVFIKFVQSLAQPRKCQDGAAI